MDNKKRNKSKIIWLFVLILFICVAITTLALTDIMDIFLPNDQGAISLIPEDTSETQDAPTDDAEDPTTEPSTDSTSEPTTSTEPQATEPVRNPSIQIADDKTVWDTNTKIELFKISYENGEQVITVKSDDGDKVIAPGTENTYTFKLKNTGDVALDYKVEIEAYCTPADITIPITGRICRYDGSWVVGGKESYVSAAELNKASDSATIGAGKFTYYTLDWLWPFESGDDELDTLLGSMAKDQDLSFTIVIKTTATESSNPYDDSGITPPQTGDNSNLTLWFTLAIGSFIMLINLLFIKRDDDEDEEEKKRIKAEAENS